MVSWYAIKKVSVIIVDYAAPHNKAVQIDNLRGVCIVMSLSLHFTTIQTPHKLRLTAALTVKISIEDSLNQDQISFIANCAEVVSSKLIPVHGGCLYASSALAVLLSDEADMEVQVSVGGLELDGTIVFKNSSVEKLLKLSDGIPKNWNGHCWVTVENIIIDMSIFQTIYSGNNAEMMSKFDRIFGGYKAYLLGQTHKLIELGIVYNEIERLHSDDVDILFGSGNKLGIISS